jgi:hypothetical protein
MDQLEILQNLITDHLNSVYSLAKDDPERITRQHEMEETIRQSAPRHFNPFLSYSEEQINELSESQRQALAKIHIKNIAESHNQISRLIKRSREDDEEENSEDDEDDEDNDNEEEDGDDDVDVEEGAT